MWMEYSHSLHLFRQQQYLINGIFCLYCTVGRIFYVDLIFVQWFRSFEFCHALRVYDFL